MLFRLTTAPTTFMMMMMDEICVHSPTLFWSSTWTTTSSSQKQGKRIWSTFNGKLWVLCDNMSYIKSTKVLICNKSNIYDTIWLGMEWMWTQSKSNSYATGRSWRYLQSCKTSLTFSTSIASSSILSLCLAVEPGEKGRERVQVCLHLDTTKIMRHWTNDFVLQWSLFFWNYNNCSKSRQMHEIMQLVQSLGNMDIWFLVIARCCKAWFTNTTTMLTRFTTLSRHVNNGRTIF